MNLTEKIACMSNTCPIPSLGLLMYNWGTEATHGVHVNPHGYDNIEATNFAFPITTASSFNRSLWFTTASHIGHEARAFMNAGIGWSSFWAPVVNLAREPRWGRNLETPGEDPYLSGQYAIHFVKGMQEAQVRTL